MDFYLKTRDVVDHQPTTFKDTVNLEGAEVTASINSRGCTFEKAVIFKGAEITGPINFKGCTFEKEVDFEGAEVTCSIEFRGCTFKEFVCFRGTKFPQRAVFSDCVFEKGASFAAGNGKSGGKIDCLQDELYHLNFDGTKFYGYVTFNNRTILRSTKFRRAVFHQPPHFQNAELHSGTKFEGARFCPPQKSMNSLELSRFSAAYRRLSILMRDQGDTRLSTHFHSLDMSATRLSRETSYSERAMLTIYWGVSNYGRSISRPFLFLFTVSLCNAALLWLSGLETGQAVATVVNETFSPFSGAAWPEGVGGTVAPIQKLDIIRFSVSAFQGLGVVTSLSLFLFALRRRFD